MCADLVGDLVAALGAGLVDADPASLQRYTVDASPIAIKSVAAGSPLAPMPCAAVTPRSPDQIAAVLSHARARRVPLTARGLGSSVVGSAIPLSGGIVVDMKAMNRVLELDEESLTVRVEPGINGGELESHLNSVGLTMHFSPQSLFRSSVGGWIATRASGQFSSRWGGIEDLVVGLEVMLADGNTVKMARNPRSAMGPDLIDLFIGSEGTLGVVVSVTLRVFRFPESNANEALEFDELSNAVTTMRALMQSGLQPYLLRLYDADEANHVFGDSYRLPLLLLGFEGAGGVVAAEFAAARAIVEQYGGRGIGDSPVSVWLERRYDFSKIQRILDDERGVAETVEVAADWGTILTTYGLLKERLAGVVPHVLGHFSHAYTHGTSLYMILLGTAEDAQAALEVTRRLWEVAMTTCLETGAVLSHHHGVGIVRLPYLEAALPHSLGLLRAIKAALDPDGILAPGKLGLASPV